MMLQILTKYVYPAVHVIYTNRGAFPPVFFGSGNGFGLANAAAMMSNNVVQSSKSFIFKMDFRFQCNCAL